MTARPSRVWARFVLNMVSSVLGLNRPGSLSYLHPDYEREWWWYELARVSYVGGQEYLQPRLLSIDFQWPRILPETADGYNDGTVMGTTRFTVERMQMRSLLHRHEREQTWEYENRRTRSLYINFYAPIINMLVDSVIRKPATRTGDPIMDEFWGAPDQKREQKMSTMMAHGLRWAQVYRVYHAIVDVKSTAEGGDGKPYFYWVSPLDILDWECDDDGNYVWVKQFISGNVERPTWEAPLKRIHRYRIWGKDEIVTYETDARGRSKQEIERRKNTLGVVPIVPLFANRNPDADHPDGVSQMADLPKISNGVYNLYSLIMDIAYKQVFSLLIFPDKKVDAVQIGTSTVVGFDGQQTTAKPEFIAPDPNQPRVLMEMVGSLIEQARQAVGVGRGRSEGSKQQASADALELESKSTETIMVDVAGSAEDFERRLAKMVQRYKTAAAPTGVETGIEYPREFDVRSLQADIMEATSMKGLGMSPEVMQRVKQDIVRRKFPNMPEKEMDALLATIKAEPKVVPPGAGAPGAPGTPGGNGAPPPQSPLKALRQVSEMPPADGDQAA